VIPGVGTDRRAEPPVGYRIREIDPAGRQDIATVSRLHLVLLDWGPMARFGEFFLRRFCYTVLLRDGLMRAALFEVDGRPAGFVAYTSPRSPFTARRSDATRPTRRGSSRCPSSAILACCRGCSRRCG